MLAALVLAAVAVADVPNPRTTGSWVVDQAGVLSAEHRADLDGRIDALDRDLGVEAAVVTVPDVDTTPKEFATALFERWHIGKAGADNGLLVLLVRDQRRLEMETGYGLEPLLPDGWLGALQAETMVPRFRTGDYGGGLQAGLAAIDARLREHPAEAREGSRRQPTRRKAPGSPGGIAWWLWLPAAAGAGAGAWALGRFLVRRRHLCPNCRTRLILLDEVADDAHLDAGQRREEKLGSVDYRVYICPACQYTRSESVFSATSKYWACERCGFRTASRRARTLVRATPERGGEVAIIETCKHCGHKAETVRQTRARSPIETALDSPRRHPDATWAGWGYAGTWGSSGGSSDGWSAGGSGDWSPGDSGGASDFGGGESGGGGAGSSW